MCVLKKEDRKKFDTRLSIFSGFTRKVAMGRYLISVVIQLCVCKKERLRACTLTTEVDGLVKLSNIRNTKIRLKCTWHPT